MTYPELAVNSIYGISEEANTLRTLFAEIQRCRLESIALGEAYREANEALDDVFRESAVEDWDGYGAMAVDAVAHAHAQRFLDVLPTTLPAPEVAAEPDGEIEFEWHIGHRRVFSVSVGQESMLTYAGMFGLNRVHGSEYFADELPIAITENLDRLFQEDTRKFGSY